VLFQVSDEEEIFLVSDDSDLTLGTNIRKQLLNGG